MESSGNSVRSLECMVCLTYYNSSEKRPRVLFCGHTFCSKCIDDSIEFDKVTCPTCRKSFKAKSCHKFPINFELERGLGDLIYVSTDAEEVLMCPPKDTYKSISKKLKKSRREAIEEVDEVSRKNSDISSHLDEYNSYLEEGINQHKALGRLVEIIIKKSEKESNRIKKSILEQGERSQRLENVKDNLVSAATVQEICMALEDVNICCEDLHKWNQTTVTSFPNSTLLQQSMEVQQMGEIILKRFSECENEVDEEVDENKKEESLKSENEGNKEKTTAEASGVDESLITSASTGETPDEEDNPEEDENISRFPSIQQKFLDRLQNRSSWMIDQSVKTSLSCSLKVKDLVELSPFTRELLETNRVFAIQEDEGKWWKEKMYRCARFTLEENDRVCVHSLGYIPSESLPQDSFILKFDDVMRLVEEPRLFFLELGIGEEEEEREEGKEEEEEGKDRISLGKMFIRVISDSNLSLNFTFLCTGEMGQSYANTNLMEVWNTGQNREFVRLGDYEKNGGEEEGGNWVVPEVEWKKEWMRDIHKRIQWIKGLVRGRGFCYDSKASQFEIFTRDSPGECDLGGIFGEVEEGLHILKDAIGNYPNIGDVKIIDCGMVLSK